MFHFVRFFLGLAIKIENHYYDYIYLDWEKVTQVRDFDLVNRLRFYQTR